jgi:hypothetical protein
MTAAIERSTKFSSDSSYGSAFKTGHVSADAAYPLKRTTDTRCELSVVVVVVSSPAW